MRNPARAFFRWCAASDQSRDRLAPLFNWAGHYSMYLLAVATPVAVASIVAGRRGWLIYPADAAMAAWQVALVCDLMYHQFALCIRCIRESPAVRADQVVSRWKPALWFEHQRRLRLAVSGSLLGWIFYTATVHHEAAWQRGGDVAVMLLLAVVWVTTWQHRRLQPWCPWCHWGRGGRHEQVPAPPGPGRALDPSPAR